MSKMNEQTNNTKKMGVSRSEKRRHKNDYGDDDDDDNFKLTNDGHLSIYLSIIV